MSCQQATPTKNSDDPYIFTDTPISSSVYSSQLSRLSDHQTTIKFDQHHPSILSQSKLQYTSHSNRTNGQTTVHLPNGQNHHHHQQHITGKGTIYSRGVTPHNVHVVSNATTNKLFIRQKPITPPAIKQQQQLLHPSVVATTTSAASAVINQVHHNYIKLPASVSNVHTSASPHNQHFPIANHSVSVVVAAGPHQSNHTIKSSGPGSIVTVSQLKNTLSTGALQTSSPASSSSSTVSILAQQKSLSSSTSFINESRSNASLTKLTLKCDQQTKLIGDNNSNQKFSIPKTSSVASSGVGISGTNSGIVVGVGGGKKILGNRFVKRSVSQSSSTTTNTSIPHHHNHHHDPTTNSAAVGGSGGGSTDDNKNNRCRLGGDWHAPGSYVFDYAGPGATNSDAFELTTCVQTHWLLDPAAEEIEILNRDQRLEVKKSGLRRKVVQCINSQKLRSTMNAKRRLLVVARAVARQSYKEDTNLPQKCCITNCSNDALAMTAYCYLHITHNTDQMLFRPCTAIFSDNSQCRVPVFDIIHELPLCREHAWKRDNYDRMLQEQKPKKSPRKKPKPSAMTRPPKRNKKKKKPPQPPPISSSASSQQHLLQSQQQQQLHKIHHPQQQQQPSPLQQHFQMQSQQQSQPQQHTIVQSSPYTTNHYISSPSSSSIPSDHHEIHHIGNFIQYPPQTTQNVTTTTNLHHLNHHSQQQHHHHIQQSVLLPGNDVTSELNVVVGSGGGGGGGDGNGNVGLHLNSTQDMLNVCENSSAYESSEDTGVGGLSESELIHHDVIEEIPLGDTRLLEEHDLTNVLNQIPEETFNEFLSVEQNSPFEPTQEEKEDLERALEAVDEQVKSLQQITGSDFLGDFLDGQMLCSDDGDICTEVLTSNGTSEIRGGLVHT